MYVVVWYIDLIESRKPACTENYDCGAHSVVEGAGVCVYLKAHGSLAAHIAKVELLAANDDGLVSTPLYVFSITNSLRQGL
jgi:hypothetical protein